MKTTADGTFSIMLMEALFGFTIISTNLHGGFDSDCAPPFYNHPMYVLNIWWALNNFVANSFGLACSLMVVQKPGAKLYGDYGGANGKPAMPGDAMAYGMYMIDVCSMKLLCVPVLSNGLFVCTIMLSSIFFSGTLMEFTTVTILEISSRRACPSMERFTIIWMFRVTSLGLD
jgi:hypothetical protein